MLLVLSQNTAIICMKVGIVGDATTVEVSPCVIQTRENAFTTTISPPCPCATKPGEERE